MSGSLGGGEKHHIRRLNHEKPCAVSDPGRLALGGDPLMSTTFVLLILSSLQSLAGIYSEEGIQLFATHYSFGPTIELRRNPLFVNARVGYQVAMVSRPTWTYPYTTLSERADSLSPDCIAIPITWQYTFHGWLWEISAGWHFKVKPERSPIPYFGIFVGVSKAHTWAMIYDQWAWEDSWAVHAGVTTPISLTLWGNKRELGSIYSISWLDAAYIPFMHDSLQAFTHTTPFGLGLNLWLFKWEAEPPDQEQETDQQEDQP